MPRQARIDYPGALHHVIGRGIEGKSIFKEEIDKEDFYNRIKENLSKSSMQLYAWCIMENHFHLLIQTGKTSISEYMRKLLTGYAINYNKRNKRKGYLFQNRYKSIICDKDEYLLTLIRYIHLNPVKAKTITINQLKNYKWTGHKEIINRNKGIIVLDEVWGYFSDKVKEAIRRYEEYIKEGLEIEEDYNRGGLINSLGGAGNLLGLKEEERQNYDERILGKGDFVNRVLDIIDKEDNHKRSIQDIDDLLKKLSKYYNVKKEDILQKSTKNIKNIRNVTVYLAKECLGMKAIDTGRILGITQSTSSRAMSKGRDIVNREGVFDALFQ